MPRPTRKHDVLRAASDRFFRDGISATGVDAIVAAAGVAKTTLYSNFASKDDLAVAYLEDRDRRFCEQLEAEVAQCSSALERALTPIEIYRRYLDEDGFHGCAFINAAAELPVGHPGREVIARHKQQLRERWGVLLAELDVVDPHGLALECLLVLEGAFTHAGLGLDSELFDQAAALIQGRIVEATRPAEATSATPIAARAQRTSGGR